MLISIFSTSFFASFFFLNDVTVAHSLFRPSFSPTYRNINTCPQRCSVAGTSSGNWSAFPNLKSLDGCTETLFYDFSLHAEVDNETLNYGVHACSSFGPDFSGRAGENTSIALATHNPTEVHFEVGWWDHGSVLAASGARSVIKQMRDYIRNGHQLTDKPLILFGRSGQASVGLYIGHGLINKGLAPALKMFEDNLAISNISTPTVAVQLCGPEYDRTQIFGMMATSNATFSSIQQAIKSWDRASCLSFSNSTTLSGQATFSAPLPSLNSTTRTNATISNRYINANTVHSRHRHINARGDCKTIQVEFGDICGSLAAKCGIPITDFERYLGGADLCNTLMPKQHVCCSSGALPNFSPKPNSDGSCNTYQVVTNDNCDNLAAEYSLTKKDLEDFNKNTWGWSGCDPLFVGTKICLSKGTPPFPAALPNAVCGPQKPGSKAPTDASSNITDMNPCPLNACCNIWGQCGITKDFCVDTNTGAPGTAKTGTFGCISNCGTNVIKGDGHGSMKIAYFEGYGMNRDCLFQDASQIDTSQYTHVHFAFGTLTPEYEVEVGDVLSTYNFNEFKKVRRAKRVLSFGGWAFSTEPATYNIFRTGVTSANRLKMATNIANFIKKHELDGVDIDWEYPGAPDIPGIPPASQDDGPNYLAFLAVLKNLLGSTKTVSIAAPSSYWYLKQYPLKSIGKVVDYIVFMTYDLHGQWDTDNSYSQEGCANGNCLRSQVNLTETKQSLAMITKAGVPGKKVIVGITSYGRSYSMVEPGCWGPDCLYSGGRGSSDATPGKCTNTAGYIADAEIAEIISGTKRSGRVTKSFLDVTSNSDILVYDDNQWVSYMSSNTKKMRAHLYSAWGMGGTTDWSSDLQKYNDPPAPAKSWATYKQLIMTGEDPKNDHTRTGEWTKHYCTDKFVDDAIDYTPSELWKGLAADDAWKDIVRIWTETDSLREDNITFSASVANTLKLHRDPGCDRLTKDSCDSTIPCDQSMDGPDSGPAAQLIWDSLVAIHMVFADYHERLFDAEASVSLQVRDLENKFAPIPEDKDQQWTNILLDLVTMGTLTAAGPFFNSFLKTTTYFAGKTGSTLDNVKDTTVNLIGQGTTLAKDLYNQKPSPWTSDEQDSFSATIGQAIDGWGNVTAYNLELLFDGDPEHIETLYKVISDGKMLGSSPSKMSDSELRATIAKSIFAWSIPRLWRKSKSYAFILDSGYGCSDNKGLEEYVSADTMAATGTCIDGKAYFLVHPDGDARSCECHYYDNPHCENVCTTSKFSAPPGLGSLDGQAFGGISREDLIKGSLRTYLQNGGKNGGGAPDPRNQGTMADLLQADITTPGYMRLPVCSPEKAFVSWDTLHNRTSTDNWPCDVQGRDHCGESTFENQSSSASPKIDDCLQIIKNIEPHLSTDWTTQTVGHKQRKIASAGGCSFGVEATKVNGNVNFKVGGQDVIDIINDAISQFGSDGRIGAKGIMKCSGNVKQQEVKWGIY